MQQVEPDNPVGTLNGICPYFTMFPLDFPYQLLARHARPGQTVLDPFCGRGTTNYAARLLGLSSFGIDSSPVAAALSQAKLANARPNMIVQTALRVLDEIQEPQSIPQGEFWERAYEANTLRLLCRLREGLLANNQSPARKALRAVLLGALHGPRAKVNQSYFSNQSPRTFAPKPDYALRYWRRNRLSPPRVDVIQVIKDRALRYYTNQPRARGRIVLGDSRLSETFARFHWEQPARWIITSPPYYGLRTYLPDQWLRMWFLGGPPYVDYRQDAQMNHSTPDEFAAQLRQVWSNLARRCAPDAQLIIRFGGINDRRADPMAILKTSLIDSGWTITTTKQAGSASAGKRQALHFGRPTREPKPEWDVWARL